PADIAPGVAQEVFLGHFRGEVDMPIIPLHLLMDEFVEISEVLHERDGVGGYAEVLPKYFSYLLDLLLNLRPWEARLLFIPYDTLSCQCAQHSPRLILVFVPTVGKTELSIVAGFPIYTVANLN